MADCELHFAESKIASYLYLQTGEIDIIEGVHDNEHNQVTWHTSPGYFDGVAVLKGMLMYARMQPDTPG